MLNDFRLALLALREPVAWKVLAFSVVAAGLILLLLAAGMAWLVVATGLLPWDDKGWVQLIGGGAGFIVTLVAGWFLFPGVLAAIAGLFLEYVADAIERRYYPALPPPRQIGWGEQISTSITSMRRAMGRNMAALPLYFIPGLNLFVYVYFNGRTMAEEYFLTAALRRRNAAECAHLFEAHRRSLYRTGYLIAFLSILPLINLIAPLLAVSLMTHKHARLT